jgi:hypothetical protein
LSVDPCAFVPRELHREVTRAKAGQTVIDTGTPGAISASLRDLNNRRRIRRMRRVVISAADATRSVLETSGFRYQAWFVTLTYRSDGLWTGKHVSDYLRRVRNRAAEDGVSLRYQWVLELTKRGRPHYHVIWWVPYGYKLERADQVGDWRWGFTNTALAVRPVGYVVKYASKGGGSCEVGRIPKGARLFGVGGGNGDEKHVAHRAGLPMWLDACLPQEDRARRVPRVGFVGTVSGQVFTSPFRVGWHRDNFGVVIVTITRLIDETQGKVTTGV